MDQQHKTPANVEEHFPWEGAFVLEDFRRLRLSHGINAPESYIFLTRQIQRWPQELSFHVSRIECSLRMNNEDAVYAAVMDLFFILEDKGKALRKRVIDKLGNKLSNELKSAFEQVISGQTTLRSLPISSLSVLHDGLLTEHINLDLPVSSSQITALDPVNTARLCMESGQIEQAQEILESQLEIEPEREEIRTDLLEIYCATRDKARFMTSYQLLQFRGCLDNSWEDAATHFATSN